MQSTPNAPAPSAHVRGRSGKLLIGGRWVEGERTVPVADKFTGETLASLWQAGRRQVAEAVAGLQAAFARNRMSPHDRSAALARAADLLEARRDEVQAVIVAESGFSRGDARREFDRGLQTLRLSAEEARRINGEMIPIAGAPGQEGRLGFTLRVPLGVVCAITPFNSPLNTVLHKVAPALAAGNAVLLKPASYTPLTAELLCELLIEAGFPPDLIALLHGPGGSVGEWLCEEQAIRFYTFTGSTGVGLQIQQRAGLRRTQMELGSIASTILCADADVEAALPKVVAAGFRKAGQVCTSIQRLYVHAGVLDRTLPLLLDAVGKVRTGNPHLAETVLGPMIDEREAVRAKTWIDEAAAGGARILAGGERNRALVQPTVIAGATPGMRVYSEEIFAPVMTLVPFDDLTAAIADINATPYGLAAGIFTNDLAMAFQAARGLEMGGVHINETSSSRVDLMPYGGCKASGFGREGPAHAIRELTEERLITIAA